MIAVILVNWNRADDTIECLESLLRLNRNDFRVIVCDNGSAEDLGEKLRGWISETTPRLPGKEVWRSIEDQRRLPPTLRELAPGEAWDSRYLITLVQIGWNSGFAHANNVGLRLSLANPAVQNVWFLNNDTIVAPDSLSALIDRISEDPAIGICGSTLRYYHQPNLVQALGGRFQVPIARASQIGHLSSAEALPSRDGVEAETDYIVGASMLVRRRFLEDVGEMEERYFLYFEELDWARRAGRKWRLAWAPGSAVFHKEGAAIGTNSAGRPSTLALFYTSRSLMLFYAKFHKVLLPIAILKAIFYAMRCLSRRDVQGARAALEGAAAGLGWLARRSDSMVARGPRDFASPGPTTGAAG